MNVDPVDLRTAIAAALADAAERLIRDAPADDSPLIDVLVDAAADARAEADRLKEDNSRLLADVETLRADVAAARRERDDLRALREGAVGGARIVLQTGERLIREARRDRDEARNALIDAWADAEAARAEAAAERARAEDLLADIDERYLLTCSSCPERDFHARSPQSREWLNGIRPGAGDDLMAERKAAKRARQRRGKP